MYIASVLAVIGAVWFYRTQRRPARTYSAQPASATKPAEPGDDPGMARSGTARSGVAQSGVAQSGLAAEAGADGSPPPDDAAPSVSPEADAQPSRDSEQATS
jgi:hypothetical protein